MDQRAVVESITTTFAGVDADVASRESGAPEIAWGDTFFIDDADRALEGAKRFPFATIVTKNYGDFDNLSNLDREDVFRLNIGLSRETYESLIDASADTTSPRSTGSCHTRSMRNTTGCASSIPARKRSRRCNRWCGRRMTARSSGTRGAVTAPTTPEL